MQARPEVKQILTSQKILKWTSIGKNPSAYPNCSPRGNLADSAFRVSTEASTKKARFRDDRGELLYRQGNKTAAASVRQIDRGERSTLRLEMALPRSHGFPWAVGC